ncbi:flap endonuclease 1 isoform X4 [Amblyraja radiata]|uniref:flap endonuclease 1 isoform X4 n=1 Tax=Amblyraja radiata TaxID=386614 RepID=UPI00140422F5|nr:flap endonuclease 1 isoform X4 [Amblyraja radiata]
MGINRLAELIRERAAGAITSKSIYAYEGSVMALDAAVVMNQFRMARPDRRYLHHLSQIVGVFYRTASLLEKGIKPVFVFDGPAPRMKSRVGTEQREKRKGEQNTAAALDGKVPVESFVRNGRQDCQRLLTLLGVPYIEAPGEAEATCAALVRAGLVHCTATEDMDALPFGCSRLVRHVTASPHARVEEFSLPAVLQALQLSHEQFVDLCILLGCDYCDKIHGVGPGRALPLLQQHHSLDGVVQHLRPGRLAVPEDWPYREARRLFLQPAVTDPGGVTLEWGAPDEEGLVQLLVHEKHAKERRVRSRIQRLRESLREVERRSRMFTAERQQRLDDFYSRVGALRYRRQGDEPHFKLPKTRRRIARRNLSHPPLRRRPHPRTCPPAPSTALPAGPENLPVTLPLA